MTIKKSMWVLFGICVISAWVFGSTIQAGAETMKCQTSGIMVKREVIPIPGVEGHTLNISMRDGLAFFEQGEVSLFKAFASGYGITGKGGQAQGYFSFTFVDGSSIITSFRQTSEPDSEGKFASYNKFTGEILKGTSRFEGIKGSLSGDGKLFKPEKGELSGKSNNHLTFTYTLPSK
jgi:hypothetical protein